MKPTLVRSLLFLLCAAAVCMAPGAGAARRPVRATRPAADWLASLCDALPEMGLEAGVNACAPRLNDLSEAGQAKVRAALARAERENAGATADAALIRARLVRERMQWQDFDLIARDPGLAFPVAALTQPLLVPEITNAQRLEWAASRMEATPLRIGIAIRQKGIVPPYFLSLSRQTLSRSSLLAASITEHAAREGATEVAHTRMEAALSRIRVMAQNADYFFSNQTARASGDARPQPALFGRLLREGYGFSTPPDSLEAALVAAVRAASAEVDSLTRAVDASHNFRQILDVLQGAHPTSDELLAGVGSAFRAQERASAARWPELAIEPLEITEIGLGRLHQGMAVGFLPARPLAGRQEVPAYAVTAPDPNALGPVQEAILSQCNFYADTVAAARHDAPGEAALWRVHRAEPPARLWAAGPHTFQAWGYFAQDLSARSGLLGSAETRLMEAWTRLLFLARGQADMRLGLRRLDPPNTAAEIEAITGQETPACVGAVNAMLENPGRRAGAALRFLEYRRNFEALRARGASERQALQRLAASALYLPADQARMLGL